MKNTRERATRRLATPTTLKRELIENARHVAVIEVRTNVKTKIKNLAGSAWNPTNNFDY